MGNAVNIGQRAAKMRRFRPIVGKVANAMEERRPAAPVLSHPFYEGLPEDMECRCSVAMEGRNAAWRLLEYLKPGAGHVFYTGNLPEDRKEDLFLNGFADVLQRAAEDGEARLYRVSERSGLYSYGVERLPCGGAHA